MRLEHWLALGTLVVGIPLNLYVTVRLWRMSLVNPRIRVLRERALVATVVLFLVVVFALVFANNDLTTPVFDSDFMRFVTRSAVLILALVPALYWLHIYWGKS